jgi:DNA-binding NtrC family response regulator
MARTIAMNLEDRYDIRRETALDGLSRFLDTRVPNVIVADLFAFSEEVAHLLELFRTRAADVPLITLRGYLPLRKEVSESIESMSLVVFYKPVDAAMVSDAVENVLSTAHPSGRRRT